MEKNFCFGFVKDLLNACSHCDLQEVLGIRTLKLLEVLGLFGA